VKQEIAVASDRTYKGTGTLKRTPGEGFIFRADSRNTNITIDGLTFDGGGFSGTNGRAKNLLIQHSTIKNITKGYPYGNGILLTYGAEDSTFINNQFININGETAIYGFARFHNVEIAHNFFKDVNEGIHFWYDSGDNLHIHHNEFVGTRRMAVEIQGTK